MAVAGMGCAGLPSMSAAVVAPVDIGAALRVLRPEARLGTRAVARLETAARVT